MENKRYPSLCNQQECTGCAACVNICPKDAITMIGMADGFLQPVVEKDKCVQCLACERTCPVLNVQPNKNRMMKKQGEKAHRVEHSPHWQWQC